MAAGVAGDTLGFPASVMFSFGLEAGVLAEIGEEAIRFQTKQVVDGDFLTLLERSIEQADPMQAEWLRFQGHRILHFGAGRWQRLRENDERNGQQKADV